MMMIRAFFYFFSFHKYDIYLLIFVFNSNQSLTDIHGCILYANQLIFNLEK
jgi:hypothetical protein